MLVTTPVRMTKAVLATVTLVSTIAPLATDMYVPAFPQVGSDLAGTATAGAAHPDHLLRRDGAGPADRRTGLGRAGTPRPAVAGTDRADRGVDRLRVQPVDHGDDGCPLRAGPVRRLGDGHRPGGHRRPVPRPTVGPQAEPRRRCRRHRAHRRPADRRGHPAGVHLAGVVLGCRGAGRADGRGRRGGHPGIAPGGSADTGAVWPSSAARPARSSGTAASSATWS